MLANRLKILLAERDLTIKDVVNAIGLSRPSVSNMVNNPFANIATENVDKLCNYLEVTPKDFFDYSGWRFKYELLTDVSEAYKKNTSQPAIQLNISMKSGKLLRTFQLDYVIEHDMDYGDNVAYDAFVTAYAPNGDDDVFLGVYKKMSPLFKHQIESELLQPVPVVLQLANNSGEFSKNGQKISVQFNYVDFHENTVYQRNFIFDRKKGKTPDDSK